MTGDMTERAIRQSLIGRGRAELRSELDLSVHATSASVHCW
jgi:hypothetical protein